MRIPSLSKLSTASQLSLLAIVILLGAVFFTVNSALQQQNERGHAAVSPEPIAYLQPRFVQGKLQKGTQEKTSLTFGTAVTHGDLLVIAVANDKGTPTVIDNRGDVVRTAIIHPNPGTNGQISIFYVQNAVGGTTTITAQVPIVESPTSSPSSSTSPPRGVSVYAAEYNGISTTNAFDQAHATGGYSTAINSGNTAQTTQANELIFGAGMFTTSIAVTASQGNSFVLRGINADGTTVGLPLFTEDKDVFGNAAYNAPFTSSKIVNWRGAVATFRAASLPVSTPTPTRKPTLGPTQTPQPSHAPSPTPRVSPTSILTPSPSVKPSPSPTLAPGSTAIKLSVALHGIGTGGDSANPSSKGNADPHRPSRTATVEIYDAQNQLVVTKQATLVFNTTTGKFAANVDLGNQFTTGLYTVKIKTEQYLRALIPGIQTITAGQQNTLPLVTLVVGDANGDNQINIVDYNLLIGCYSDLLPPVDCQGNNNVLTDFDDDGHVNQFDYNLFLRELTNVGGQ